MMVTCIAEHVKSNLIANLHIMVKENEKNKEMSSGCIWLYHRPISQIPPCRHAPVPYSMHHLVTEMYTYVCVHWCKKVVTEYLTYESFWFEIWVYCLQLSVDQCSIWSVFGLIYSLKCKITQNPPKRGQKLPMIDPFNFNCMAYQNATTILPIGFPHWTASSNIHICTVDWRKICLIFIWFFPVRYSVLHHRDPIRDSQRQIPLIIDAFPAHAAWLGLTATMY